MDQQTTYALLAAESYRDTRPLIENGAPLPPGWKLLNEFTRSGSGSNATLNASGFSARVYQGPANEIVVSYGGTEFNLHDNATGAVIDFVSGNVLALGVYGEQAFQAAKLYQQVQQRFGTDANISFTGHSLGGGLAGLMAVWFERPAIVFAPAPFEASTYALSDALVRTRTRLHDINFRDPKFDEYSYAQDFANREARVTSYSIKDEVLHLLPFPFIWGGSEHVLYQTGFAGISATQRHSIDLHAAALLSPAFQSAANAMPEVLTMLFDTRLYGSEPVSTSRDALIRLVRSQVGEYSPSTGQQIEAPTNLLNKFAADVDQLRGDDGMAAQVGVRKGLIAAAIEYYYVKDPASTSALLSSAGDGIHFKFSDIGAVNSKARPRLVNAVNAFLAPDELRALGAVTDQAQLRPEIGTGLLMRQDAWHVQTGTAGMVWTGTGSDQDAAVGGAGIDILDGAAGDDILIGGADRDFLTGGTGADMLIGGLGVDALYGNEGNDQLMGGADADTYTFAGAFGSDVIEDTDGAGNLVVTGLGTLSANGAKRTSPTSSTWQTDDKRITYSLVQLDATHQNLVITAAKDAATDTNVGSITIRNWSDGQLGITLGTEVAAPATTTTYSGDYAKATNAAGDAYLVGADGNYVAAGPSADAADVLNGSDAADWLQGTGGNDGLAGSAGDDLIEGGAGNDLLLGSWGADTINGGAGNDFIFGSALGSIARPTAVGFTAPASSGVELARGFSWVAYRNPGNRIEGDVATLFSPQVAGASLFPALFENDQFVVEASGNVIDGGAGDDYISAGNTLRPRNEVQTYEVTR